MNEYRQIRVNKRNVLIENNINPYPIETLNLSATCTSAKSKLESKVAVAGRVMAIRSMGKASFIDIHDETGKIQGFLSKKVINPVLFENLDLGDIVRIFGEVKTTKAGEITIFAEDFQMLSKSLAVPPLSKEVDGQIIDALNDVEIRHRKRYLDLISNQNVRDRFRKRSQILNAVRNHLNSDGFIEVETPTMQSMAGGAKAQPFVTHHNALDMDLFLRVAPELYLKRLLVGGMERIYEIGKCYRNEGIDSTHNPEFTMLEVYAAYADCTKMMGLITALIRSTASAVEFNLPAEFDIVKFGDIAVNNEFDESKLIRPTFVVDYPQEISPLAKTKANGICDRFELFINGMEVANGYSELNDPDEQLARFKEQNPNQIDYDYIEALETGMPPAGGFGIGIDRLIMILTNTISIREVILFPQMRKGV